MMKSKIRIITPSTPEEFEKLWRLNYLIFARELQMRPDTAAEMIVDKFHHKNIYRAAMEALTLRLKQRLEKLEKVGGFKSTDLLLVGGGARNKVWTQMRADILGLPIRISNVSESTVLGASMYAFAGAGVFESPEACRDSFGITYTTINPGEQQAAYAALYN